MNTTKKFLVICPECGKERHVCYHVYHYRKSDLCHACHLKLYPRTAALVRGKRLKAEFITILCDFCGKPIERSAKRRATYKAQLCDARCRRAWMKTGRFEACRMCGKLRYKRPTEARSAKTHLCYECQKKMISEVAQWRHIRCDYRNDPIKRPYWGKEGLTKRERRRSIYHFCGVPCRKAMFRDLYKSGVFVFGERIDRAAETS